MAYWCIRLALCVLFFVYSKYTGLMWLFSFNSFIEPVLNTVAGGDTEEDSERSITLQEPQSKAYVTVVQTGCHV